MLKIKNYKCFGENEQGFEQILPINIIVGKNNSGKSTLLELVEHLITEKSDIFSNEKNKIKSEIKLSQHFSSKDMDEIVGQISNSRFREVLNKVKLVRTISHQTNDLELLGFNHQVSQNARNLVKNTAATAEWLLAEKVLRKISAERDIVIEKENIIRLEPNGSGATTVVQVIRNDVRYETRLVNKILLKELNEILNPEVVFTDIHVQINQKGFWEIYFEDANNGFIALSKMGSGVKTILLVLLNLLIIPEVESNEKSKYVFAFEELENNLHPALLRRLFSYIIDYAKEHNAHFFITTHSNVVIDMFGDDERAQIIHVVNDGSSSTCTTVNSHLHGKNILRDLDVRASDLLQSNGIIWVEGPSDRVYINKWLSLVAPELKEGLHYSILFYGGRLLANLSFDYEWLAEELIPLLKINHNAFVVIDRDGESDEVALNKTKLRIQEEVGAENCWVTNGREIENYLSDKTIGRWLSSNYQIDATVATDKNTKLEKTVEKHLSKLKYDTGKKRYSTEISQFISVDDLAVLDLGNKLNALVKSIKVWNSIPL